MDNKEKFLLLVSPEDEATVEGIRFRQDNKEWLRESRQIALKVLLALKELGMTQKDLAKKMGVSPQYVNKLVKGNENLTLETITKLQNILNINILFTNTKTESHVSRRKQVVSGEF